MDAVAHISQIQLQPVTSSSIPVSGMCDCHRRRQVIHAPHLERRFIASVTMMTPYGYGECADTRTTTIAAGVSSAAAVVSCELHVMTGSGAVRAFSAERARLPHLVGRSRTSATAVVDWAAPGYRDPPWRPAGRKPRYADRLVDRDDSRRAPTRDTGSLDFATAIW